MLKRFEQFAFAISSIDRDIQKLERDEMIKYGYKGSYAQYLIVMSRYPEGITAAELCVICDKDKAAVSRIVAEMTEKGLVTRISENGHYYRAKLRLTEEGKKAVRYVSERAKVAVASVGSELSDADRQVMYSALELIAARLHRFSEEGLPEGCGE